MTSSPDAAGLALPELLGRPSPDPQPDGAWAPPELASLPLTAASFQDGIEEAAHARGYAEGLRDGEDRAARSQEPALQALAKVTGFMEESAAQFARDRERDLTSLALAVARKLVQREVAADPDLVCGLVARALDLLPMDVSLEVRLNPDDLAALQGQLEPLTPAGRSVSIHWAPDPALERGSFVIETPQRIVDGRADTALRALYERLTDD